MIEVIYACMFGVFALFLFSVFRLMFKKNNVQNQDMFSNWKFGMFVIILSSLTFFLYFTLSIGSIGIEQTMNVSGEIISIQSNSYIQVFNLMPLVSAIYFMQWILFAIEILYSLQFFGRQRMNFNN